MKTRFAYISTSGIIVGLAFAAISQALAIEPPPDNAEPPAPLLNDVKTTPAQKSAAEAHAEIHSQVTLPFIGLATAAVPDMVSDHLDLAHGTGVIIRTIAPGSPAEKAGLSVNDIILSIGETAVGNPEAVSSAIRERKAGDRIAIDLIHKGKPAKVEVTLSERPSDEISGITQDPMLDGLPKAHADRLRDLIEKNLGAFGNSGLDGAVFPDGQLEESLRMMRDQMNRAMGDGLPQTRPDKGGGISFQQNSTARMMDNEGSIEIQSSSGDTEVTVRDEKNETVWSGPWNSEKEKSAAPDNIRKRIEKLNTGKSGGFSFQFGGSSESDPGLLDN